MNVTPTRLALLRDVRDGCVVYSPGVLPSKKRSYVQRRGERIRNVTRQMNDMADTGWVTLGPPLSPSIYARRMWWLTEQGTAVLRHAERAEA